MSDSLRKIITIDDVSIRIQKYNEWVKSNVCIVTDSQMVLRPGNLTSEQKDFIVEHLANQCVKELLNKNMVKVEQKDNRFIISIATIRKLV